MLGVFVGHVTCHKSHTVPFLFMTILTGNDQVRRGGGCKKKKTTQGRMVS